MSTRTVASWDSKWQLNSRRRAIARAASAVIENLERRMLMSAIDYHWNFEDSSAQGESDESWFSGSNVQSNGTTNSTNHFRQSSGTTMTLSLDGSSNPLPSSMLHIDFHLLTFNSTNAATLDVTLSGATFDPALGGSFSQALNKEQVEGGDVWRDTDNYNGTDDYDYAYQFDFIPQNSSSVDITFTVSGLSGNPKIGLDNVAVTGAEAALTPGCNCNGDRLSNGQVGVNGPGLHSQDGGITHPIVRVTSGNSGLAGASDGTNGNIAFGLPVITLYGPTTIRAVDNASSARYFDDPDGDGTFTARFGLTDTLTRDSAHHEYRIASADGSISVYHDFSTNTASVLQGKLADDIDSNGNDIAYTYDGTSGHIDTIEHTDSGVTSRYSYGYFGTSSANSGKLQYVTQETQSGTNAAAAIRTLLYGYYDNSGTGINAYGELGDLMTVTTLAGGSNAATIDTTYYRYWVAADPDFSTNGYSGALKMVLGPAAFDRAVGAGFNPLSGNGGGTNLTTFADTYYTYDPDTQRVKTKAIQGDGCSSCSGGIGTYSYSYTSSGIATGFNMWNDKTVTILPDNNNEVDYFNAAGEPILSVFQQFDLANTLSSITDSGTTATATTASNHGYHVGDLVMISGADISLYDGTFAITGVTSSTFTYTMSGTVSANATLTAATSTRVEQWGTIDQYDSAGRLILEAQPSAVNLPPDLSLLEGDPFLRYNDSGTWNLINDSAGEINTTVYYDTTDAEDPDAGGDSGGVAGYLHQTFLQQGESGTPILQTQVDYFEHTNGGSGTNLVTIFPVADIKQYRNTNGTGEQVTTYSRTWYSNSVQMRSEAVTAPAIDASHNGNDAAETTTTFFDTYGRPVSTLDADGYITDYTYDSVSGAIATTVVDSDTPYPDRVLADGPLAYWRLGESSGTDAADSSGNGFTGTNTGTLTLNQGGGLTGDSNTAYSFGGGYVNGGHDSRLSLSSKLTVEAWINSSNVNNNYQQIVTKSGGTGTNENYELRFNGTTGKLEFVAVIGGSLQVLDGSTTLSNNTWYHVVVTYNGSEVDLYINGVEDNAISASGSVATNSYDVGIGARRLTSPQYPFAGKIDEVAIYDHALSAAQIATHYSAGRGTIASRSGLNLTTTTMSDALGRPTKITDPNENAAAGTGNVTYVVYDDANHEEAIFPGWHSYASGTNTLYTTLGPATLYREDRSGSFNEELTYDPTPGTNATPSLETITLAKIRTLSRTHITEGGQVDEVDRFFDFTGISNYLTGTGTTNLHMGGTAGTNYYATTYGYDSRGRNNKIVDPAGTISRMVYDGLGRLTSTWVGTDDVPSSGYWSPTNTAGTDLTKLADYLYDTYDPAVFVAGDSNLTRVTTYPSGTNGARTNDSYYDWRDRLVATKSGVYLNSSNQEDYSSESDASVQRLITYMEYDNLDEVTQVDQYDGDAIQMVDGNAPVDLSDGVPDADSALRARTTYDYDDQGRVWQTRVYSVSQSNGTPGNSLKSWTWYDHRGDVIKTQEPGGLATKYAYDGAGRVIKQYSTDAGGDDDPGSGDTWDDAGNVTGDDVLEQTEYQYDANSNVVFSIHKLHYHNDSNTGELGDPTTTPKAEVMYTAFYYDRINRPTATVDHGSNGGLALAAPPAAVTGRAVVHSTTTSTGTTSSLIDTSRSEPTDYWIGATLTFTSGTLSGQSRTVIGYDLGTHTITYWGSTGSAPAGSVTYTLTPNALVNTYDYNDSGWQETATDPRGIIAKTYYDLAGRTTKTIANYADGVASNAADDQITEYTFDGNDNILTMKAVLNNTGTNSIFQTTQYVYGVFVGTNITDSNLTSNDLLAEIQYPDPSTGDPSTDAANIEALAYNAQGQQKTLSDRNGNVHQYTYDELGRLLSDSATTLGADVTGAVRRLSYNFDTAGRPYQMTSYSNTAGTGTPVNQVQYAYNGYGQLTTEYQSHSGAVNTGSTPSIQNAYNEGGDNAGPDNNNSRLKNITYPNGRVLRYEYGTTGSLNDSISRVAYLADDDSGSVGTHLEEYQYLGLSTLVTRNRPNANSSMTLAGGGGYSGLDRFNRIVNQTWIETSDSSNQDSFAYAYDPDSNPLYKKNNVDSTFSELYHANGTNSGYDQLNRLTDMRRGTLSDADSDGVYDTVSTLNSVAGSQKAWSLDSTGNWNSSVADGSTTTRDNNLQNQVTQSGTNTLSYDNAGNVIYDDAGSTLTYDAWNRMTSYLPSGGGSQLYRYDALGRRIGENNGTSTDLYYSAAWQVLEERQSGIAKSQNVWSPFYVDDLIERDRDVDGSLDGSLDSSFGSSGKTSTDFSSRYDTGRAVAIQSDGKTVVAGDSATSGTGDYDFAVARYNLNGSLDTSFGSGGKVTVNFGSSSDYGRSTAVQSDGKILVAGESGGKFALMRLTPSGSLDTSFGSGGKVTTTFGTGGDTAAAYSIAIQTNGEIVLGGYADISGHYYFAVARYNPDGTPDTSFSSDGQVSDYDFGTGMDSLAFAMALEPDGQIVVGGQDGGDLTLGRFNADGSLDYGFGASGIATTSITGTQQINGLIVQPDGKIIAGGVSAGDFIIARFDDDGGLDTGFGTSGYTTTNISGSDAAYAMVRQADGKFVVAGVANGVDFAVVRYTIGGVLDTTFNSTGKVTTDFGSTDIAYALAIGPDYKITVAGSTGSADFAVARYKVVSGLEERLYVLTDANHNVTAVTDVFGIIEERFVYDPYGAATVLTASWTSTSDSYGWATMFQGKRFDATTQTYDFNHRVYRPTLGTFMQADMSGYPDGADRYQMEVGNPLAFVDPFGLSFIVSSPQPTPPPFQADPPTQSVDSIMIIVLENDLNPPPGRQFLNSYRALDYIETIGRLDNTDRRIRELIAERARILAYLKGECNGNSSKEEKDGDEIIKNYNEKFGAIQSAIDTARKYLDGYRGTSMMGIGALSEFPLSGMNWGSELRIVPNWPNLWTGLGWMGGVISIRDDESAIIAAWGDEGTVGDKSSAVGSFVGDAYAFVNPTTGLIMAGIAITKGAINAYFEVDSQDYDRNTNFIICMKYGSTLDRINNELKNLTELASRFSERISDLNSDDDMIWNDIAARRRRNR